MVNRKAIFLDREGVINEESDAFIKTPDEFILLPGAAEAIKKANEHGFHVIVVSNQSGVPRGLFSVDDLKEINEKMIREIGKQGGHILHAYYCAHHPECPRHCRKPEPGMLLAAASDYGIDLAASYMIGDRTTDIEAGKRVGCKTILVLTGRGQQNRGKEPVPDAVAKDLAEAVDAIIAETRSAPSRTPEHSAGMTIV